MSMSWVHTGHSTQLTRKLTGNVRTISAAPVFEWMIVTDLRGWSDAWTVMAFAVMLEGQCMIVLTSER